MSHIDIEEAAYELLSADATIYGRPQGMSDGYIVGLREFNVRIGKQLQDEDLDTVIVKAWLEKVVPTLGPYHTIGSWHDPETGDLHLDKGVIYWDRAYALGNAGERGELAIWDIRNGAEIRVRAKDRI